MSDEYINIDTTNDNFSSNEYPRNILIPEIYAKIREKAMNYGYTTKSNFWTSLNMAEFGNDTLEDYGYSMCYTNQRYVHLFLIWTFTYQVQKNIDEGYPVMWNQLYGNYKKHSMVVKGYTTYKKECRFWFFTWTKYIHFMEMNDNWHSTGTTTYIDFDAFITHEAFGTFVDVKDYLW